MNAPRSDVPVADIFYGCVLFFAVLFLALLGKVAGRTADGLSLFDEILAAFGALPARGEIPAHEFAGRIARTAVIDLARLALHAFGRRAADGAGARKLGDALIRAAFDAV